MSDLIGQEPASEAPGGTDAVQAAEESSEPIRGFASDAIKVREWDHREQGMGGQNTGWFSRIRVLHRSEAKPAVYDLVPMETPDSDWQLGRA